VKPFVKHVPTSNRAPTSHGQARDVVPRRPERPSTRMDVPLCAYHVSGEYAMVKAAAAKVGSTVPPCLATVDGRSARRRDFVLTYFAREIATELAR